MQAIKKNLKDQTIIQDNRVMYCNKCGSEYSADAGDYWVLPDAHKFKCCNKIMTIVIKKIVYIPVLK